MYEAILATLKSSTMLNITQQNEKSPRLRGLDPMTLAPGGELCQSPCAKTDGSSILALTTSCQSRRLFSGVSGAKPVEPGSPKTVPALCKPTTGDHTALKSVIDRPPGGIPQASGTFGACPRSEWGKGIQPKGKAGMDLPSRHRCIRNRLAGLLQTGGI